jgi:ribosomal protein S18 acetylase RimI-like enzyme
MQDIRTAGLADAAAVTALLWAARGAIPFNEDLDQPEFALWHEQHCRGGNYLVIDDVEGVVGAMLLLREEIYYLVVAERGRRHGLGTALIHRAQHDFPLVRVKVSPANGTMQRLLDAQGFERLGRNGGWVDFLWQAA